jgi:drug/metabolite transporter (DMT)-like permease
LNTRNLVDLVLLGALWGAAFLFMRIAAPVFGPVPLIEVRVAVGALCLLPLLAMREGLPALKVGWHKVALMGVANTAIPFCLFAFSTLTLTAGFASIINATSPLWGALIGWLWLGERLSASRVAGLAIGFAGVLMLAGHKAGFHDGAAGLAIAAACGGALLYGFAANFARRHLAGIPPLVVATGNQLAAALVLLGPALWLWPDHPIPASAWVAALVMGVASTGLAFILYFRLIARAGPAFALAVTYLIPMFAMLSGTLFLGERPTGVELAGCAVILLGTAFATGMLAWPRRADRAA